MRMIPILMLISVLAAPGCSRLFNADFEADTSFSEPNLSPAGPPTGDEITLESGVSSAITVTPNALEGARSLRIEAAPREMARARMIGTGPGDPDRPVVLSLTGRLAPGGEAELNVSTGAPVFAVQITLANGDILVNGTPSGSYTEGGQHQMLITLFPFNDTYSLLFTGQVLFGDAITGPLNDPDGFPGSTLQLAVEALSTAEGSTYIVDDIRLSSRNF